MKKTYEFFAKLSKAVSYCGGGVLIFMIILITANVLMRRFFNRAFIGTYEIAEILMALLASSAMAYSQSEKAHIHVTILLAKFPRKLKFTVFSITGLLSLVVVCSMSWAAAQQGTAALAKNMITGNLGLPMFPFYYIQCIGMTLFACVLALDVIKSILAIFNSQYAEEVESHWV